MSTSCTIGSTTVTGTDQCSVTIGDETVLVRAGSGFSLDEYVGRIDAFIYETTPLPDDPTVLPVAFSASVLESDVLVTPGPVRPGYIVNTVSECFDECWFTYGVTESQDGQDLLDLYPSRDVPIQLGVPITITAFLQTDQICNYIGAPPYDYCRIFADFAGTHGVSALRGRRNAGQSNPRTIHRSSGVHRPRIGLFSSAKTIPATNLHRLKQSCRCDCPLPSAHAQASHPATGTWNQSAAESHLSPATTAIPLPVIAA